MTNKDKYDKVRIANAVDGTVIEGHDAVQAHLDHEEQLLAEHGSTINLQFYRASLKATSIERLQGSLIAEIRIDGDSIGGDETVADVKQAIHALIARVATAELAISEQDHVTLFLSGKPLQDDSLFYADNFIMLPVWIQCCIHACDTQRFLAKLQHLISDGAS